MSSLPIRFTATYVLATTFFTFVAAVIISIPVIMIVESIFRLSCGADSAGVLIQVVIATMIVTRYRRYYPDNWREVIGLFWPQQPAKFWAMVGVGALLFAMADGLLPMSEADIEFHLQLIRDLPLPLLLSMVVIMAPIVEELLFRQYLWQGFQQRLMTPLQASLVTSLLWALGHYDYSFWLITALFFYGLFMCWIRWRSGSILIPIALHIANNLFTLYYYWGQA